MSELSPKTDEESRLSFEEAFTRLGQVVSELESGSMTLEQTTQRYEEGMRLAHMCSQFLAQTEVRMTELRSAYLEQMPDQSLFDR